MHIIDFNKDYIAEAKQIAFDNYNEERSFVAVLPEMESADDLPGLENFADNGLGVAAFEGSEMTGFLCCLNPWNNAFRSSATGTFSPIHAHGAVYENRYGVYKRLYQAAAEKWVGRGIMYHAVALYAHDVQAIDSFFTCGFGLRCVDAIRPMICPDLELLADGIAFSELPKTEIAAIREMRLMLVSHLGESPCFMRSTKAETENWIKRAESRDSRIFIAHKSGEPVAYLEVRKDGENFASEAAEVINICGAYCLPEYRGKGITAALLDFLVSALKKEFKSLGVDFESFNLTANGFWLKHFTAYTGSVTRRIDECTG